jgi:hypothetical protein
MTLLVAAACTDRTGITEGGSRALTPKGSSRNISVTGAVFTTDNEADLADGGDGTGHCKNGNPGVNCNIYDGKAFVWLTGGPGPSNIGGPGQYFFAVLQPGGQLDPNDGQVKVLSDIAPTSNTGAGDAYTDRTFSIADDGAITYSGPHKFNHNKIRLIPYDDTPNPGGVYILAVCSLASGYPVNPSKCKYDAFKVQTGDPCPETGCIHQPEDLTVTKDAAGSDDKKYTWTIDKSVDKTTIKALNGNASFNYTVEVKYDGGTVSNVKIGGTIDVFNSNVNDDNSTASVSGVAVTDQLSGGSTVVCTVTGGANATLTQFDTQFAYSCDLGSTLPTTAVDNTVTVSWSSQDLSNGAHLAAGTANFGFASVLFTENSIDESITVTDTYAGTLGTVTVGDLPNPKDFTYSRTIPIPATDCLSYDNTATFTTNDTQTTGSDKQTVTVCRVPPADGALTMGFWQNKNGQGIITGQAKTGVCASATWLRQYLPFQDLSATSTCAQVGTYVLNIIKAANASGATMNAMLKAQMLATALDVYFSDPTLGGNKIGATNPIGGINIDLTQICKMIDGSGGTATCSGVYQNVSSAFGGATALTVSQILAYAATQSNVGGTVWYGQAKATQEMAKNTFDAISNQVAFQAP